MASENEGGNGSTETEGTETDAPEQTDEFDADAWKKFAGEMKLSPEELRKAVEDRESWKKHARTWETRAKDNGRALEEAKRSGMSDPEKALAQARDEGIREATQRLGRQLAAAEFRARAAGKVADVGAALEETDLARFVKEDGSLDEEALTNSVNRWAKLAPAKSEEDDEGSKKSKPKPTRGPQGSGASNGAQVRPGLDRLRNAYAESDSGK